MRLIRYLFAVALAAAPTAGAQHYALISHGDTVAIEQLTRHGDEIWGMTTRRNTTGTRFVNYVGSPTTFLVSDSSANGTGVESASVDASQVRAGRKAAGELMQHVTFAVPNAAMAQPDLVGTIESLLRSAPQSANDSTVLRIYLPWDVDTATAVLRRMARDSVRLRMRDYDMRLAVDESGAIRGGTLISFHDTTRVARLPDAPPLSAAPVPATDTLFSRVDAQHDMALLMKIRNPRGVQSLEQVSLGGVEQWISIRGNDRDNPLMLFIHGGPGDAMMTRAWAFQRPWEDYFTVVQWDQRGGGKNALSNPADSTLSVARDVADAEALVPILLKRFHKRKLVIIGHSFGTVIGSELAARHPGWVSVYVGVGQAAPDGEAMLYHDVLAIARSARNDKAVKQLEAIAGYPHVPANELLRDVGVLRSWSRFFGGGWYGDTDWSAYSGVQWLGPEYTDTEMRDFERAESQVTVRVLAKDFFEQDAKLPRRLGVPVVFMMGRHDLHTPYSAAKRYFDNLAAPSKEFVTFENSAHVPFLEEPGRFFEALMRYVLPRAR